MTASTFLIELRKVSKRFGSVEAVRELSLAVPRGSLFALLGASGCGKTTVLRLVAGLEKPDSGEVKLNGRTVAAPGVWVPPEARRVGMVFQDYALFPHLTVAANIAFPLNGVSSTDRRVRVAELMALVGLDGLGDRYPHQLSGGQQQRVALARALAPRPEIVLLDEPFSNLDAGLRQSMRAEVRDILRRAGATTIFVTHDQEEALSLADIVAVMNAGAIEQVGAPAELFALPATRFVAEFLGGSFFLPAVVTARGVETEIGCAAQGTAWPPGMEVDMLVRPDDLTLRVEPGGAARIESGVFRGDVYIYQVRLASGRMVRCFGPHFERYAPGTAVTVELTPGHPLACFPRQKTESPSS
ncbi:MAG: ABC transporter ATP-binding protein [Anaerolineales bacterium]|nr:ABC transporter ATP-binding protein [Anaerolineales bacterium]